MENLTACWCYGKIYKRKAEFLAHLMLYFSFLEKCKKRACFLSESVLKYITVRRMSDTNASEKTDEK